MGQKANRPYILVETPDFTETTIRNTLLEFLELRWAPEHDADADTRFPNNVGDLAGPEKDVVDAIAVRDGLEYRVVAKSPSDTKLSTTGGSGNVSIRRWAGRRR